MHSNGIIRQKSPFFHHFLHGRPLKSMHLYNRVYYMKLFLFQIVIIIHSSKCSIKPETFLRFVRCQSLFFFYQENLHHGSDSHPRASRPDEAQSYNSKSRCGKTFLHIRYSFMNNDMRWNLCLIPKFIGWESYQNFSFWFTTDFIQGHTKKFFRTVVISFS